MPGFRGRGKVDRHHIAHLGQVDGAGAVADAEFVGGFLSQAARPPDDVHAERLSSGGNFPTDSPQPDDAECAPVQPSGLGVLLLVPDSLTQVDGLIGDPPVAAEYESPGDFRDRDGVLARTIGHEHAPGRSRGDVDVVITRSRTNDQAQVFRYSEYRLGHLGRAHDQHIRILLGDCGGEILGA